MTNITFREVDYYDLEPLYDYDGLKEISGKNNALYIISAGGYSPVNGKEYEHLASLAENIANDFNDLIEGNTYYFRTFKEICNYYGVKYSPATAYKLKNYAVHYTGDYEDIAEFLTITTGEKWNTYSVAGYSQGDYATGIYCTGHYTTDALELYVGAAAGTVSEFCRIEDNESIYGYYVPDSIKWNTAALKEYLASMDGDNTDNIKVELFNGYIQTASYTEV